MTTEDELIAAIVAAPDDDAPRLVYADWLTERGDLRGELIVVGCALARLDRYDPRWRPLRRRELDLESQLKLGNIERGFPKVLGLKMEDLSTLPQRLQQCPYEHLDITVRDDNIGPLLAHKSLGTVKRLKLTLGAPLAHRRAIAFACWEPLAQLDALELEGLLAEDLTFGVLFESPHLRRLRHLFLAHYKTRPTAPLRVLCGSGLAATLQELTLAGFTLPIPDMPRIGYLRALRRLSLLGCEPHDQLGALDTAWVRLETLFLSASGIDDRIASLLEGESRLRRLSIDGERSFDTASLRRLVGTPALRAVSSLGVRDSKLDDDAIATLVDRGALSGLQVLSMDDGIGDRGAELLAATPEARHLRELDLGNRIGVAGLRALAASPHLQNLVFVGLFRNRATREIADELRARFGEWLYL
ncbi:MAG TPA: TIGR02996 domain-containing protein [Kofleriaceae bacterium]|nr:TIGR02996 domain-containing protein [Kofleriaceae bacterium]